jgi:hypothetical protein
MVVVEDIQFPHPHMEQEDLVDLVVLDIVLVLVLVLVIK